jgi:anti-anti-sigma factor
MMMARPGSIRIDAHGDVKVVWLIGEHDMTTAAEVQARIDALAAEDAVVVSLDETEFFDSSVIHALVAADRRMKERDRRLVVQAATPAIVEGVLKPSGLVEEVVWTQSLDEAIAVARQPDASAA